jgi:threonine aldolase
MDGARFANAVVGLSASPAALSVEAGIDVLCFGATKNGALAAEAMIFFDEALAERAIYFQKRAGQAASKMRFVSAQLLAMLDNELWLENARIANQMAWRLAEGAAALGHALRYPVEINEVFLSLPRSAAEGLRMEGFQFQTSGPEPASGAGLYRFVASFATEPADIDRLLRALKAVPPSAARG